MIWFVSDLHLGHKRGALEFRAEKGYKTVEEHDEDIFRTLAEHIKKDDRVYHLGDLTFKHRTNEVEAILDRLYSICEDWVFIEGNHDEVLTKIVDYQRLLDIEIEKQRITLCHYPLLSYNKSHFGAWNLHGHHHSDVRASLPAGKRMNICWEVVGYKPVSFDEVKAYMETQPFGWDYLRKGEERERI